MSHLEDAMKQPALPPGPHYVGNSQVTCGVLLKYVNFGKGWRHRVFVLKDGVFRYYKIFGMHGINLPTLLDSLRREGEVVTIGTETGVLESKRTSSSSFRTHSDKNAELTPQGEVHLQVCTVQESDADNRKFYVNSGTSSIRLRAETEDDRQAWLGALQKSKSAFEDRAIGAGGAMNIQATAKSQSARASSGDPELEQMLTEVRHQLSVKGAGPDLQAYVEQLLLERHQAYNSYMTAEADKRRLLLDHVSKLENEKRQLETNLVVEQRIQNRETDKESLASQSDDEQDEDDGRSAVSNEDGSDDVFFECNTDLSRLSSKPLLTDETSTSGTGQYSQGVVPIAARSYPQQAPTPQTTQAYVPPSADLQRSNSAPRSRPSAGWGSSTSAPPATISRGGSGSYAGAGAGADYVSQGPPHSGPPADSFGPGSGVAAGAGAARGGQAAGHAHQSQQSSGQGNKDWIREMQPPPARRERLPTPKQHEKSVSLWSILKECVGKDLSRICLPVYFNEPLSVLQKTVEDLEYAELLNKAATFAPQSIERMLHVAAFAVSGYSGTNNRTLKPFNPLLGETFEFQYPEQGWRGIAEKVVHHPTVIAAHGEGERWTFAGDAEVRSKFWGRSIELIPVGLIRLKFDDGDEYNWTKVTSAINNLIMGKIYIEHTGIMRVTNLQSTMVAKIKFKESGRLSSKDAHQIVGAFEKDGQKLPHTLTGKWDTALEATMPDGTKQRIWTIHPPPAETTRYNMTRFAMILNEITPPGLEREVAPTDCRLRPDQHALEEGIYDQANSEKQRLEVKQRAARKAADEGVPLKPRWFSKVPNSVPGETPAFQYAGGYWEARKTGNWEGCRDIFGPAL
ncbi:TPA: hypothetical protein ACH3X2_005620 [Trebouxia sp. C0005]